MIAMTPAFAADAPVSRHPLVRQAAKDVLSTGDISPETWALLARRSTEMSTEDLSLMACAAEAANVLRRRAASQAAA